MFWVDEIVQKIKAATNGKPQWVDDMKTPSGRIHVGSLRGVIIHDLLYKALKEEKVAADFSYVIQEYDSMDGISPELEALGYQKYMGFPLVNIPSPDANFKNLGHYYASEFIEVFNKLGARPAIIWESEFLRSGKMNAVIKTCLDHAAEIRQIYKEVSGSDKGADWYPFQVICEKCGRIGTTRVYDWDGEKVAYQCEPEMVAWAKGCGNQGKISPFDGTGKLPWKVDWAALWNVIGISVEAAGKDHMSEGGSHDIAERITREVLKSDPPFSFSYEWFIIGGKKMSSSKGVGSTAKEVSDIIPPELLRFLMTRVSYRKTIDFNPQGMTIPDLFDEYDRCAKTFWKEGKTSNRGRAWELSQINQVATEHFMPRFIDVVKFMQMPNVDLRQKFTEVKGKELEETELKELEKRIVYAKIWLEQYAPAEFKYLPSRENPDTTIELDTRQKEFLKELAVLLGEKEWEAETLQNELYQKGKSMGLKPQEIFRAIYLSLIGKDHGPKAAWLLLDLERNFVLTRIKQVISDKKGE